MIYGKSGSGKTTLLNILAGIDTASQGNVYYMGNRYNSMKESKLAKLRGNNYGFVFQAYHLILWFLNNKRCYSLECTKVNKLKVQN